MRLPLMTHQVEELALHGLDAARAINWEQGTGKTALALATFEGLATASPPLATGLLVVAPNGVHRAWVRDEAPKHLALPAASLAYSTEGARTKGGAAALEALLASPGPAILSMSYDAVVTERGLDAASRFLRGRPCLLVLDESQRIKTPRARRTRACHKLARLAPYRRTMSGTPIAQGPFDAWSQYKALDPRFWDPFMLGTFTDFKARFGVFRLRQFGGNRAFNQLVAYRDLEALHAILAPSTSRVTKDEVLDLPPKTYTRRSFDLYPAERRAYGLVRDEVVAELGRLGEVTAALAITRLLRLQQVASGFVTTDDREEPVDIPGGGSRLDHLLALLEDDPRSTIVWCRFRRSVERVYEALRAADARRVEEGEAARGVARYDGSTPPEERDEAARAFQAREARYLVANPAAAGEGLNLYAGTLQVYYENSFNLVQRLQSEDREHRKGQEQPVEIVDLVAEDTIDDHVREALSAKHDVASIVNGDVLREWLR